MTTPTFANSGNKQPIQGGEVACCSIAGGPFAAVDAYVSGGASGVQLEFRLYATVGILRTLVARATYAGPPVGAAGQGTVLKWTVINQPAPTNPMIAGATVYDLVVFGVNGAGSVVQCTLAGTNAYDAAVNQSGTAAFPANFGSATIATNTGCAQLADVGVDERGVAQCALDILVSCGAGSVEALVQSGQTGGTDGLADVLRQIPLPVGTQYRLAVRNVGIVGSGNVTASLATYESVVAGNVTPAAITPGPQFTVLRSVQPITPTQVVWASTGYIDFVADCGADPTGVLDIAPALDKAYVILQQIVAAGVATGNAIVAVLKIPPGFFVQRTNPVNVGWNLNAAGTELIIEGCGDASVIAFDGGALVHFPDIVVERFVARDFAMYGVGNTGAPVADCDYALSVAVVRFGNIDRVHFVNIFAGSEVVFLTGGDWAWNDSTIEDCCGVTACLFVRDVTEFVATHFRLYDVGKLNRLTISGKAVLGNGQYFRWQPGTTQCRTIKFMDGFVDELCTNGIVLLGTAAFPLLHAVFEDIGMNPPSAGGSTILAQHVDNVDVSNYSVGEPILGGFNPNSTSPILDLQSVVTTRVVDPNVVDAANAVRILADAACGSLEVINPSDNVAIVSLASATSITPGNFVEPNEYKVALSSAP